MDLDIDDKFVPDYNEPIKPDNNDLDMDPDIDIDDITRNPIVPNDTNPNTPLKKIKYCYHCASIEIYNKLKKCGKCKVAYYCSAKCQLKDWPFHKIHCTTDTSKHIMYIVANFFRIWGNTILNDKNYMSYSTDTDISDFIQQSICYNNT